jgi:hypothetical protein
MADKQGKLFNDPALYRKLSEPFATLDEADAATDAFLVELRELRAKHRIADVSLILGINVMGEDGEGRMLLQSHVGDTHLAESMLAYAYGAETALRQERTASLLTARAVTRKR